MSLSSTRMRVRAEALFPVRRMPTTPSSYQLIFTIDENARSHRAYLQTVGRRIVWMRGERLEENSREQFADDDQVD